MYFKDFFDILIYFLFEALFPPENSVRIMDLAMNPWYNGRSLDLELDKLRFKLQSFMRSLDLELDRLRFKLQSFIN